MKRTELGDLAAYMAVAEERSFTRAAAQLGTSQSALSHTVRRLEARLGVRLLTRSTRSVTPTEAGERLLATLRPALDDIDTRLAALSALRDTPAGTVRITASPHPAESILWPALTRVLPHYPDIKVEIALDATFVDIVAERFDAGVRMGDQVGKDMVAMRIGPDLSMAVVGAPRYFEDRPPPRTPRDLARHACLTVRLPTHDAVMPWEFSRHGRSMTVRVEGPLVFNEMNMILRAAHAGFGLAYVVADKVASELAQGTLVRVLEDWCPPFSGYHLYYPSRRQLTPAFAVIKDALRFPATGSRN